MLERILPSTPEAKQYGFSGAVQAGIYAQAYRMLDATNMIAVLFAGLLLPIFARMLKYKESVEQLVKLSFTLLVIPAVIVATGCTFYRVEIMSTLYHENIDQSPRVFSLLMCCFMAVSTIYIFSSLLTANGNLKELNTISACGMILNISLNFILIPRLFAFGSAITALLTQSLTALAHVIIVQRKFKFKVNYRFLVTLVSFVVGVIIFNYLSKTIHYTNKSWFISFAVMVALSVLWAFVTRLISIKSMFRVLKYG